MENIPLKRKQHSGVTLIEMTVVIVVLTILVSISILSFNGYRNWQIGSIASQALREVDTAQRTYLSDFPTQDITLLTQSDIEPYLSSNTTFDILRDGVAGRGGIEGANGEALDFNVTVSPPTLTSAGVLYDGTSSDSDGLWDLGR